MRTYAYAARISKESEAIVREQIHRSHRYANALIQIERVRRQEGRTDVANERAKEAIRAARAASGVYWGTYLLVEDAIQRIRRAKTEPKFRRWDGSGQIAVQLQGGISVAALTSGADLRVRLSGEGRIRTLHLRVGSNEDRSPIWAAFGVVYHRELPGDAKIKWVRVLQRRAGTHYKYSAQFCIDTAAAVLPRAMGQMAALDVGWRLMDGDVRIAYWVDDAGAEGEIRIPKRLLDRWSKVGSLESIRDRAFGAELARLRDALSKLASRPPWLMEASAHMGQWKSQARLASLALRWRDNRFDGDAEAYGGLEAWRKQDKHLFEWAANQRQNVLRSRKEIYRIAAKQFATRYATVAVEKINLAKLAAKKPDAEPAIKASMGRRFLGAPGELLSCLADALGRAGGTLVEVASMGTTDTCHLCGVVSEVGAPLIGRCEGCGASWDQDANAARNILRAAQSGEVAPGRSRMKTSVAPGESEVAKRRRAGKERQREGRSKMTGEARIANG